MNWKLLLKRIRYGGGGGDDDDDDDDDDWWRLMTIDDDWWRLMTIDDDDEMGERGYLYLASSEQRFVEHHGVRYGFFIHKFDVGKPA